MTGYADHEGVDGADPAEVIQKPFSMEDMEIRIRDLLVARRN